MAFTICVRNGIVMIGCESIQISCRGIVVKPLGGVDGITKSSGRLGVKLKEQIPKYILGGFVSENS